MKLYEKIDGEKTYEGILQNVENDTLSIEYKIKTRKKIVEIPYDKVAKARLAVLF